MTRLGLAATALSGLIAGAVGAETSVRSTALLPDPLAFAAVAAAGLVLAGVLLVAKRPAARPRAASRNAKAARKRVLTLVQGGAAPEHIARDTGLPLDVVIMAVRAGGAGILAMPQAATVAEPRALRAKSA